MKQPLLLALLAVATFFYFRNPTPPTSAVGNTNSARPASNAVAAQAVIIASAPSSYDRWKTGPYAQTDLKTGSNAQTDFAAFAPSEQATWNETPGYTITAGRSIRAR